MRVFDKKTTYFAQRLSDMSWKIGSSINPDRRILQLGDVGAIKLKAVFDFNVFPEGKMHSLFSKHRFTGEWFHDCNAIRAFLVKNKKYTLNGREVSLTTSDVRLTLSGEDRELALSVSYAQHTSIRDCMLSIFRKHANMYTENKVSGFTSTKVGRPKSSPSKTSK
jgi:hypothetical protein